MSVHEYHRRVLAAIETERDAQVSKLLNCRFIQAGIAPNGAPQPHVGAEQIGMLANELNAVIRALDWTKQLLAEHLRRAEGGSAAETEDQQKKELY